MFRCEFSGEVSDKAIYSFNTIPDPDSAPASGTDGIRISRRTLTSPAEKPVILVIKLRSKEYVNYDEEGYAQTTQGFEILKEIRVRAKHVEAAKKHYGLV